MFAVFDVNDLSYDHIDNVVSVTETFPDCFHFAGEVSGRYEMRGMVCYSQLSKEDDLGDAWSRFDDYIAHSDEACGILRIGHLNQPPCWITRFGKEVWDGLRRRMWREKELGRMRQSDGHKRWREPQAYIRIPPL